MYIFVLTTQSCMQISYSSLYFSKKYKNFQWCQTDFYTVLTLDGNFSKKKKRKAGNMMDIIYFGLLFVTSGGS